MDRVALSREVADRFLAEPQKATLASMAFAGIWAGIDELAKLGSSYELIKSNPADYKPVEYPKMLYHDARGQVTVSSREEENRLGLGWRATPNVPVPVPGVLLKPEWPKTLFRDRLDSNEVLVAIETRTVASQTEQDKVLASTTDLGWRLSQ